MKKGLDIGEIAEILPVGKRFTVDGFMVMLGYEKRHSAQGRIHLMRKDKHLTVHGGVKDREYSVTIKQKTAMMEKSLNGYKKKGVTGVKKTTVDRVIDFNEARQQAVIIHREMILKGAGLL